MSKNVVYIYRYPHIPWWYRRHDWLLATHSITTISTQKTKSKVHSQKNMYNFSKRKISQFNFGFRVDAEDFRQKNWVIRQSRKYFVWDSCTKWNVRFNIGYWHSIYVDSKTLKPNYFKQQCSSSSFSLTWSRYTGPKWSWSTEQASTMSKMLSTSMLSTPWPFWTCILSQVSKNIDEKTMLLRVIWLYYILWK